MQTFPSYTIQVHEKGEIHRAYIGQLLAADDTSQPPETFTNILTKYYDNTICSLLLCMTWGGRESRDIDILEDAGLIYDSFRCDIQMEERKFFRMKNSRWRVVDQITPYAEFSKYLERNERLVRIIVNKLDPRFKGGIWDGSQSDQRLQDAVDPITVAKGMFHPDMPEDCDICSIPLAGERFFSDGRLQEDYAWVNMCADCSIYHGKGIGWGTGQLYRKERDGRWLMVGGSSDEEDDESD